MKVTTESGTVYETTKDGNKFRRLRNRNPIDPEAIERTELRKDGQWLSLFEPMSPVVGQPMTIIVEPLDPKASLTVRMTTVVVGIED